MQLIDAIEFWQGQSDGITVGIPSEVVREICDALRAQADARPYGYKSFDDWREEIIADGGHTVHSWLEGQDPVTAARESWNAARYTHPEASAPGLSDDAKVLLSAMGFRLVDDFYLRGDVPDDSEESWEVVHRDTVAALSAGAAQLDDDAVYTVLRNYDADMTRKTAEAIAHDLRLTRASAATVAEPSGWKPAHELSQNHPLRVAERAAQQQAEPTPKNCQTGYADICAAGAQDGVACPADSCDVDDGIRKLQQREHTADFDSWAKNPYTIALQKSIAEDYVPRADVQQAEPGADERAEFETALKQYAEACHRSESCSAMDAARARVCAIFSRAAQSGQRAGVAEGWRLVPAKPTREIAEAGIKEVYFLKGTHISIDDAMYLYRKFIAAAPTQQQQEGE